MIVRDAVSLSAVTGDTDCAWWSDHKMMNKQFIKVTISCLYRCSRWVHSEQGQHYRLARDSVLLVNTSRMAAWINSTVFQSKFIYMGTHLILWPWSTGVSVYQHRFGVIKRKCIEALTGNLSRVKLWCGHLSQVLAGHRCKSFPIMQRAFGIINCVHVETVTAKNKIMITPNSSSLSKMDMHGWGSLTRIKQLSDTFTNFTSTLTLDSARLII